MDIIAYLVYDMMWNVKLELQLYGFFFVLNFMENWESCHYGVPGSYYSFGSYIYLCRIMQYSFIAIPLPWYRFPAELTTQF